MQHRTYSSLSLAAMSATLFAALPLHAQPAPIVGPATAKAQTPVPTASRPMPFAPLLEKLREGDTANAEAALTEITEALRVNPKLAPSLRPVVKHFADRGFHQNAIDLSVASILAAPGDTGLVEALQSTKVSSLLALGKTEEALAASKQLFNVATLKGTSPSILQICQCLNAVHPTDRSVLKRYRQEQMDGATPDRAAAKAEADLVLGAIQLPLEPYVTAANAITGEEYSALVARGNLLLLAGRTGEAWDVLERAYSVAAPRDLAAASENLARCIRAQDGTIGRANAWVLSLRPKTESGVPPTDTTATGSGGKAMSGSPATQPVSSKQ